MDFQGVAAPLSAHGLGNAASRLDAQLPAVWAVLTVETSGSGFLADRRPKILFERHKFHALTHGRFANVAPDLSQPTAGGYGDTGAFQYERLARAMSLDETAALKSASWGLGQVMGFNAEAVGFGDVRSMVSAFCACEDAQLAAMAAFVSNAGLARALRQGDWAAFAAGYNGRDFQRNDYDTKLATAHARYQVGPLPDLLVRWTQMALIFSGVPGVGAVDGWFGQNTQFALLRFQRDAGLQPTGKPDAPTVARLAQRMGWPSPL